MLLAVDDEVPDAVVDQIRNHPAVLDVWSSGPPPTVELLSLRDRGARPPGPLRSFRTASTRSWSCSATARPSSSSRSASRAPMEAPLTALGERQAEPGRPASGRPRPSRRCRSRYARPSRSSTRRWAGAPHRGARGRGDGRRRPRHSPTPPRPWTSRRSPRARGKGSPTRRSRPASATRWPPGGAGRPASTRPAERASSRFGPRRGLAGGILAELAGRHRAGHARPKPGPRLRRRRPDARRWSLIVGHGGVFRVVVCALLGLPLEHFWNFDFGLGAITVVEIRPDAPSCAP